MVFFRIFRFFAICLVIAHLVLPQHAAIPSWWVDDNAHTRIIAPGSNPSNFAPATLGQLKYVAAQAKKHLDQKLAAVGGAGAEINALVAGFEPRAGQNYSPEQIAAFRAANYAPVNLGQLKAVAKPFYKRIIQVGYNSRSNLISHGYPGPIGAPGAWAYDFPWNPSDPLNQVGAGDKTANYAIANLGQLKMAFSFDLGLSSDGDVLPADLVLWTENGNSGANGAPPRLGDGGNTAGSPTSGNPSPGGGGAGPQTDSDHDGSANPNSELPSVTVSPHRYFDSSSQQYATDPTTVDISWTLPPVSVSSVVVQRRTNGGSWATIQSNQDSGLVANRAYAYRIVANITGGGSLTSPAASYSVPLIKGMKARSDEVGSANPGLYGNYANTQPVPVSHYLLYKFHLEDGFLQSAPANDPGAVSYSYENIVDKEENVDRNTGIRTWSGTATFNYTEWGAGGVIRTIDCSANLGQDGNWSGTCTDSNAPGDTFVWTPNERPTHWGDDFTESVTSTDYNYSDNNSSIIMTERWEDEYIVNEFFEDKLAEFVGYPDWDDKTASTRGAGRIRTYDNDYIDVVKYQYKLQLNPSDPVGVDIYEIFYPAHPVINSWMLFSQSLVDQDMANPLPDPVVINQHHIQAGASGTETGTFEIDPTVGYAGVQAFGPDEQCGGYAVVVGLQLSASAYLLDPSSAAGGVSPADLPATLQDSGAGVIRAPSVLDRDGLKGIITVGGDAALGATWTIHISNSANFIVTLDGQRVSDGQKFSGNVLFSKFVVTPTANAIPGSQVTITISENIVNSDGSTVASLGTKTVTFTSIAPVTKANDKTYTVPFEEASGTRYRKIALNGRPMPDEKPHQTAESDEEKEETYIDALTLGLHHSTTDVYVSLAGSDLTLSARRDSFSEVWNLKGGLRPHERLDRPFGTGWSSNLCAYEEEETNDDGTAYTYVTDQNGARHRFAKVNLAGQFVPIPSDSRENGDYWTKLSSDGSTFTDRYGTQIVFDRMHPITQKIAGDRVSGQGGIVMLSYRAQTITDRLGNSLTYQYPAGAKTLIPMKIVSGSGLTLSIEQDASGHVTRIWDPNGNAFVYNYDQIAYETFSETVLTSVIGPDQTTTLYTYSLRKEDDQTPGALNDNQPTPKYHLDVKTIADPLGKKYTFDYEFDTTRFDYNSGLGYFQETGGPSWVSGVTLPDNLGHASFSKGRSHVALSPQLDNQGQMTLTADSGRETVVTDAGGNGGNTIRYTWDGGQVFTVGQLMMTGPPPRVVFYTSMKISYVGYSSESFEFDPTAGLALKAVQDFSQNTTSYVYADNYAAPAGGLYDKIFPWAGFATAYSDPTAQTDAFGHAKVFTYSGPYRVMSSVLDEEGRLKTYHIDGLGRRTNEIIYSHGEGSPVLQETDFEYDGTFVGVVTKRSVRKLGGPDWSKDLVTQYVLDVNGRVQDEIVDPDGLALKTSFGYDNNGNKLSVRDPKLHTTSFEYDKRNRLTKVVYADGSAKKIDYYDNGMKWHETDENIHQTVFEYDALNRLTIQTRVVAAGNIVTRYGYDDAVKPKTLIRDPNGHETTLEYDGLLRLTKTTDPLGHSTRYNYDGANAGAHAFDSSGFKPTTITDPRDYTTAVTYDVLYRATGKSVQYQLVPPLYSNTSTDYDKVGNPTTVRDPLQHSLITDYDALNRPIHTLYVADQSETFAYYTSTGLKWQVKDELGRTTETQYDGAGRPIAVLEPAVDDDGTGQRQQPTARTAYDAAGNVVSRKNPNLQEWTYEYDVRNRKTVEHQPAVPDAVSGQVVSPTIRTGYDYVGNVLWVQDARGFTKETSYDEANRPTTVTAPPVLLAGGANPERPTTTTTYNPGGNVLTVRDANTHFTTNTYDELNRLKTSKDAANIMVTYGYDEVGNRTSVKDGLLQETTFEYDGLNRNTTTTDAARKITTLSYNALNKTSRKDAIGQISSYGYDNRNRLTSVTYSGRPEDNRHYDYDLTGHLLAVTESPLKNGAADVVYGYDALHRVTSETSNGATHHYTYDPAGNRLTAQYGLAGGGNGRLLVSSYDELNRLKTLTEGTRTTTYRYDLNGNLVAKILPNGDVVTTHYDGLGRAYEEEGISTHGVLYHYLSFCDGVGNLRSSTEYTAGVAPRTVSMTYDDADRLRSEVVTDLSGQPVSNTSYDYDAANNRKHKTANGVVATYAYNNLNQLTSWSDTAGKGASYGYDLNGNRVTRIVSGAADTYSYDTENRLVGLSKTTAGNPGAYSYVYDYRTRRVVRTENSSSTQLVFSGGTSVQEYSAPGTVSAEYVRGSDWGGGVGGVLYSLRGGSLSYDHYDRRGDVIARTDTAGTVTWQASYEAFGTRPAEYGTTQDRQKANTKEEDPTGLLNEGMRYRDLETGTFITRDPAGFIDGPNLYAYVRQNPWTKFDPEGLMDMDTSDAMWLGMTGDQQNDYAHQQAQAVKGAWDFVKPNPVQQYHAAQQGMETTANPEASAYERAGGGFRYFGHSIGAVLECLPFVSGLEKGGMKLLGKVEESLATKLEGSASKILEEGAEVVEKEVVSVAASPTKKPNLNSNDATSNFGIYELETPEGLEKVGKADLNRVTKSSGLPTRVHQQVRKLEKVHGKGNVKAKVVENLGETTTAKAKAAENARIKSIVDKTGKVPPGNESSYKP